MTSKPAESLDCDGVTAQTGDTDEEEYLHEERRAIMEIDGKIGAQFRPIDM